MTAFEEMGVMPEIGHAVEEMGWTLPTDVQAEAIPLILGGGDVLMAAETGSGKTGAFCLPIIQIVHETLRDIQEGKGKTVRGGGGKVLAQWKMNVYDRGDSMAIDLEEGLRCQARDQQGWHGTRCMKGVSNRGAYYYEATVTDEGLCRVGWSTAVAALDLGTDRCGFGFGGTGKKSFGKDFQTYGEPFGLNDTIGCFLDLDRGIVEFSKNGRMFGKAFDVSPNLKREPFFPACVLKNAELEFNFGTTPFKHPPPQPYVGVSHAPTECVVDNPNTTVTAKAASGPPKPNAPYAVIIEPSRELAEQTLHAIKKFKKFINPQFAPRELLLIGGVPAREQIAALESGVEIVVATPGKLADLWQSKNLLFDNVRYFVLDEADGLLQQNYGDLIQKIHASIPKITVDGRRLQMIVCSATLHSVDVRKMADRLMHFPIWIDLKGQDSVPETVHHVVCRVDPTKDQSWKTLYANRNAERRIQTDTVHNQGDRLTPHVETKEMLSEAVKLLKGDYAVRAIDALKMDQALIFCRTKLDCDNMETFLNELSKKKRPEDRYTCVCLHGDRKPEERRANLEAFKRKEVRLMICTDVAARGLDISGLPYVINITLPDEIQNYVHRIGRVGRAERMGLAISLTSTVPEKVWYHSSCPDKGRTCRNTQLVEDGGCCIWYNEPNLLIDIEDHLGVTVDQVEPDFNVPTNEFDGKVVYGQKRRADPTGGYKNHVATLAGNVADLSRLEKRAQDIYLHMKGDKAFWLPRSAANKRMM